MAVPRFLVLDDEPLIVGRLVRILRAYGEAVVAATARAADRALAGSATWTGLFIDIGLPDGSGLDVLTRARAPFPNTPALVLTGNWEPKLINTAYDLRATCLGKPFEAAQIERFARESASVVDRVPFAVRADRVVHSWTRKHRLHDAEADVLRRAVLGEDRNAIAIGRASSEQTVGKHVVNLLRATGDTSLRSAVERILRELAES